MVLVLTMSLCISKLSQFHCNETIFSWVQNCTWLCLYVCTDVDECAQNPARCGPTGTCINTIGSYRCQCQEGYVPEGDSGTCVDMDECADEGMCQYSCHNVVGAYRCDCPIGFVQHYYWNTCIGEWGTLSLHLAKVATGQGNWWLYSLQLILGIWVFEKYQGKFLKKKAWWLGKKVTKVSYVLTL